MNTTLKFMRLAMAALMVATAAACSDDDDNNVLPPEEPTPDPVPETSVYPTNPNTFVVDGTESPVGTVFANTYESYILMTASPAKAETYDEILSEKYIQVMMLPTMLGQDIDLKQQNITINVWDGVNEPTSITSDMLQSGQCRIDQDTETNQCTLLVSMTMTDGTEVALLHPDNEDTARAAIVAMRRTWTSEFRLDLMLHVYDYSRREWMTTAAWARFGRVK